jgi:lipooligosaccharide transport system permease protein
MQRNVMQYKRIWRGSLITSFLQPLLYLLAMGLGVGSLINANAASGADDSLGGVPYAAFVAAGLLATTTMVVGTVESTWPVLDAVVWGRQYQAMAAAPLGPADIAGAHALWIGVRCVLSATTVALAMVLFPDVRSWGLVLAVPVAVLGGLAFAMPVAAFAVTRRRDMAFPLIQRFFVVPLFLFGGAFFPLRELPAGVRWFAYVTPLWHAVQLCRAATTSLPMSAPAAVGHLAVLAAFVVAGYVAMVVTTRRRLWS